MRAKKVPSKRQQNNVSIVLTLDRMIFIIVINRDVFSTQVYAWRFNIFAIKSTTES